MNNSWTCKGGKYICDHDCGDECKMNKEEQIKVVREAIAKILWAYPVLHTWITFGEAKELPKWKPEVKSCYDQADSILSLKGDGWGIGIIDTKAELPKNTPFNIKDSPCINCESKGLWSQETECTCASRTVYGMFQGLFNQGWRKVI
jgi:hypothetical protein